jgi:2-amino-4-hydroxy-6-hydroxymethyldihydropteridine diphosphokinase
MALIYLSIGSNIERHRNISAALDALADNFGELVISSVYESESVGFTGDSFYNLVVAINSDQGVGQISQVLKQIEDQNGRDRSAPRFGARSLDIDILTVDSLVGPVDGIDLPRDEVLKNAFVLQPMAEIAPDSVHPVTGERYIEHWLQYDKNKQRLWPVTFVWRDTELTPSTINL